MAKLVRVHYKMFWFHISELVEPIDVYARTYLDRERWYLVGRQFPYGTIMTFPFSAITHTSVPLPHEIPAPVDETSLYTLD